MLTKEQLIQVLEALSLRAGAQEALATNKRTEFYHAGRKEVLDVLVERLQYDELQGCYEHYVKDSDSLK